MPDKFYSTRAWHGTRSKVKARWRRSGKTCAYCHKPIDWDDKPTVDHVINRAKRPDLALDLDNLVVVHHQCNTRKYHATESAKAKPAIGADGYPIATG